MKAKINNPRAIRAAASLANGGYRTSVFQIRREGDRARVSGTNGYASISVLVPATFDRWQDGRSLTFGGLAVRAMMRGISRSLKDAESVVVALSRGVVSATAEVEGTSTSTQFDVSSDQFFDKLAEYDWTQAAAIEELKGGKVNPHSMKIAAQAIEYLSMKVPVDLNTGKDGRTFTMSAAADNMRACAVVVRTKED